MAVTLLRLFPAPGLFLGEGDDVFRAGGRGFPFRFPAGNGPHHQHQNKPRGEPGEVQPHVLQLGAPSCEDLDGLINGRHKKSPRPQMEKGVELHLSNRGQQPAGQPAQAGKLRKVGQLPCDMYQLFLVRKQIPNKAGQKGQNPHAYVVGGALAHQGVPPDKAQIAQQQHRENGRGCFSFCGHGEFLRPLG